MQVIKKEYFFFLLYIYLDVANVKDILNDTVISLKKNPEKNISIPNFEQLTNEEKDKHSI